MALKLVKWLRGRARAAVDWVYCVPSFFRRDSSDIQLIGDEHSGWVISVNPPPEVIYCAGVGLGISFEQELAKTCPRPVVVLDPSPTGIATVAKTDMRNIEFLPVGLAAHAGAIRFSLPKNPAEGSYSVVQDGIETTSFECCDLPSVMEREGDSHIDLLKMDIEGFEYDIVNRFLDEQVPVRQICVEFHEWLRPGQTIKTIARLYRAGYRIIHKRRGDYTFLLDDSHYALYERRYRPHAV
jgi:FkbM family methyltransferase